MGSALARAAVTAGNPSVVWNRNLAKAVSFADIARVVDGSRELAGWAADHGIDFLDGGVMAVPATVVTPAGAVFYSGSRTTFDGHRKLVESCWKAKYFGYDARLAALYDLALLAGMSATEFAGRATEWLKFTAVALGEYAAVIDTGDYAQPGRQSLEFSDLTDIVDAVQHFIGRQIDAGHGKDGFARVIESIRA